MGNSPEKARHLESSPRNLYPLFCLTNNKGGKEMLKMPTINCIRDMSNSGYRISEIAKKMGLDRKTVRKYLEQEDFCQGRVQFDPFGRLKVTQ